MFFFWGGAGSAGPWVLQWVWAPKALDRSHPGQRASHHPPHVAPARDLRDLGVTLRPAGVMVAPEHPCAPAREGVAHGDATLAEVPANDGGVGLGGGVGHRAPLQPRDRQTRQERPLHHSITLRTYRLPSPFEIFQT